MAKRVGSQTMRETDLGGCSTVQCDFGPVCLTGADDPTHDCAWVCIDPGVGQRPQDL